VLVRRSLRLEAVLLFALVAFQASLHAALAMGGTYSFT
jgi:hypothetical protein